MKRLLTSLFVVLFVCFCFTQYAVARPAPTLDDGITALQLYLDSDLPDPLQLSTAQSIFDGFCVSDPCNVTNRVYAAATGVLGVMANTALQTVCSNFGITVGSVWKPQGKFDTASTQTIDQAVDAAYTQILPVFAAAYANLDAIPTNWTGAFEISPSQFPNELTESVWIDIGDVLAMKAWLKTVCAVIDLAHGYQLNLNYPKIDNEMLMQPATTERAIVADGQTNDWAGIQPNLLGRSNDVPRDVRVARDGTNICFLMTFQPPIDLGSSSLSVWTKVNVDGANWCLDASQDSGGNVTIFYWGPDDYSGSVGAVEYAWNDAALELRLPYPIATPTNISVVDVWVETFNGEFTVTDLNSKDNLPVQCLLGSQPEFLSTIRDPVSLAATRTNLLQAIDLALQLDTVIGLRTDGLLHLVNVDPADVEAADIRQTLRAETLRGQASLCGATNIVFQTVRNPRQFVQAVFLGALFGGPTLGSFTPPAPRDLLPSLDGPKCDMRLAGAFPDPTLGGVLPGMTGASLTSDLADGAKPLPLEHVSYPQISVPGRASSTSLVFVGQSVSFQAQGGSCNEGHPVAYCFDWGDGTTSAWDTVQNKSHVWNTAGIYLVRAQAMCAVDEGVVSVWSSAWTVMVGMQPTHYVSVTSATPVYPYLTWPTAATNIQDAIDAATEDNALVIVSNGVYSTGGRPYSDLYGTYNLANRVVIDRPITVMSVIGEPQPVILGAVDPDTTFGPGSVRCAVVANGGVLHGFTLSGGSTAGSEASYWQDQCGGGVFADNSGTVEACSISGNQAYDSGGGAVSGGTLLNCQIANNSAYQGGGVFGYDFYNYNVSGTLSMCNVSNNNAFVGGGVFGFVTASGCSINGNLAFYGGGAYYVVSLDSCALVGNQANTGGGAIECNLYQCNVSSNSATDSGGGVYAYYAGDSMLVNCLVAGNQASNAGGGAYFTTFYNCTVANNEADVAGGGTYGATIRNSIVWGNFAPTDANCSGGDIANSCTTPLPEGDGNIAADPLFANPARGNYRPGVGSPCINAGDNEYVSDNSVDLGGNPRIIGGIVDMGAYEVLPLPDALDCSNVVWTTVGTAPWFGQSGVAVDGVSAAQSGMIGDSDTSWLEADAIGKGTLTFWWRVDSEANGDFLRFYADGQPAGAISGTTVWQQVTLVVTNIGAHVFRWEYDKNASGSAGADAAWLGEVTWTPDTLSLNGFALWASAHGLTGDPGTLFAQDRNADGLPNGFEYAFGTNWSSGLPIIRIRMVGGQPVVEVPTQDADTIPYVSLYVEGRTNLLIGAWTLPIEPAPGTGEKPANRDWFRASGGTPKNAYFRLQAMLPE